MRFWTTFMDCWGQADLSDAELDAYGEAYDVVYMGAEGPIAPRDSAVGLLNDSEVKARLREFRARWTGGPPA